MPRYDDYDDEDDDFGPPGEPEPNTCPQCGSRRSKKISFTMWGGAVGPAVFGLVKCKECDQQYMKKSGKPFEWSHIIAYTAVVSVLGILVLVALFAAIG
jgi:uncharacterized membrane protein YidH (DUF202 family)